jgi:hypothetical protein
LQSSPQYIAVKDQGLISEKVGDIRKFSLSPFVLPECEALAAAAALAGRIGANSFRPA